MRVLACVSAVGVVFLAAGFSDLNGGPHKDVAPERLARLIKQLGDGAFAKREAASKELEAIGEPALSALREAAASNNDIEIRRRADKIAKDIAARLFAPIAKKEIDALQGTWYRISHETTGLKLAGEDKTDRHIFTADRWVNNHGGRVVQSGTIQVIEVSDKLVKIDFRVTEGVKNGDTWLAIVERKGDVLKLCGGYLSEGRTRPKYLSTTPGDGYLLRSLKREKK